MYYFELYSDHNRGLKQESRIPKQFTSILPSKLSVTLLQFFTSLQAPILIVDLEIELNNLHLLSGVQEEAVQFSSVLQAWKHSPLLLAGKEGWRDILLKNFRRL